MKQKRQLLYRSDKCVQKCCRFGKITDILSCIYQVHLLLYRKLSTPLQQFYFFVTYDGINCITQHNVTVSTVSSKKHLFFYRIFCQPAVSRYCSNMVERPTFGFSWNVSLGIGPRFYTCFLRFPSRSLLFTVKDCNHISSIWHVAKTIDCALHLSFVFLPCEDHY